MKFRLEVDKVEKQANECTFLGDFFFYLFNIVSFTIVLVFEEIWRWEPPRIGVQSLEKRGKKDGVSGAYNFGDPICRFSESTYQKIYSCQFS